MNHLPIQASVFILCLLIAGIKSLKMRPQDLHALGTEPEQQDDELNAVLTLQQVLQSNLLILNLFILVFLATIYGLFQAIALGFVWLVIVNLLAGTHWLHSRAQRLALKHRKQLVSVAVALKPALNLLDGSRFFIIKRSFSSKEELSDMISKSSGVLDKEEKERLRAVLRSKD
jgi:CBS domain containing-hemolysin-like protein